MTLIDRLSKLDGPDREVDAAIFRYIANSATDHWFPFEETHYTNDTVPPVTASVDAAIALAERVLPEWDWGKDDNGFMYLYPPDTDDCISVQASTPAIALCIAILRAKEASK